MTPEGQVQNAICEWLQWNKVFFYRNNNTPTYDKATKRYRKMGKWAKKGVPDIVGIWKGKPLFIEVKAPGKYPSPEQKQFIQDVIDNGGIAFVARSIDDLTFNLYGKIDSKASSRKTKRIDSKHSIQTKKRKT